MGIVVGGYGVNVNEVRMGLVVEIGILILRDCCEYFNN